MKVMLGHLTTLAIVLLDRSWGSFQSLPLKLGKGLFLPQNVLLKGSISREGVTNPVEVSANWQAV